MHVEFSSAAQGFPLPITWQWQGLSDGSSGTWTNLSNGSGYSGVTTPTLGIDLDDETLDGWQYRAVASNSYASATSNPATLSVSIGSS